MYSTWVAGEGFGMQRWDTGHRRWDVDAGHGMHKWDLGCRYGMEVQDTGCSSTRAPQHSPSSTQGFWSTPGDGECVQRAGKCRFPRQNYRFPTPYRHFAACPPSGRQIPAIWPHLPARCAREGNRAPVDGKPPQSPVCRLGMQLYPITPALGKYLDGTREQWEGRTGWDRPSLTDYFHCN